jgi:translocation and assembly module TamB
VAGDLRVSHLAFQESGTKIRDVDIASKVSLKPSDLELTDLVLSAFGGRFQGAASLNDFRRYEVHGNLQSFDLRTALATLGTQGPYDGSLAGAVTAAGDTKDSKSLIAQARLTIAPGKRGIPVSGRVNADFSETANNLTIRNSYLALPHSRIDFDGSIGKQLNVSLKSQDLNDLLAAAIAGPPPIALDHGEATFTGVLTGGLNTPRISGHLTTNRLSVEGRRFDSLASDVAASGSGVSVANGALTRAGDSAPMQAQFSASAGLSAWKLLPREPVKADLTISNGDLADLVALAGQASTDYSGALTATAHVSGTAGNPLGTVNLQVAKGTIDGQAFDQAQVQANLTDQLVTIPAAFVQAGAGRVDLSGEFRHPADSFSTGHVQAKVVSNQIDLATTVGHERKDTSGRVSLNLDAAGDLTTSELLVSKVDGNVSASAVKIDGENYGDLAANIRTSGQTVTYTLTSNFAGSNVRANGTTQLARDYPTTADLSIANLAVDKVLEVAKQSDIPARGTLAGTLHLTGTLSDPHGNGDLELTKAVVYDEPIDQLHLQAAYLAQSIDVSECRITAGNSQIELTAHFDHPVGNLRAGNASINVSSSHLDLARIHNIQMRRPGLAGAVQLSAKSSGTITDGGQARISLHDLNLNLAATGVQAEGQKFGDLKLTANTTAGNRVEFAVDSSLADAAIRGHGTATLTADYPVNAQLTFSNVLYTHIAKLLGPGGASQPGGVVQPGVEAEADGQVTVDGPVAHVDQLRANLQITKLSATAKAGPGNKKPIEITNQGPISASLDHDTVQIQSAHITGGGLDLQASGHATLPAGALALTVNGTMGLGILPSFDSDIYSAGNVNLTATIHGTMSQPLVNGQVVLKDVAFNYQGVPNGISNANGTIAFNGNSASIQNLTAESGGGKITVTGFAENGDVARFNLKLIATNVRSRVQPGVSLVAGANVQLSGTSRSSVVSGTAVIDKITYNPQTDIGSLLSRAQPSVESASVPGQLLENMRLDLRVRTSSSLAVQADIAEGLSATADLRVQGTALRPAVLGRVTINEGKVIFFGSSYTVDSGTIAFYNPLRIDPILDISLATQTQGIDVTVRVSGPVDNMKLSYTSNPPLQFQEIVGLLAAGRTPTSDPTLLANQPQVPQASFQQMGESAVLGQAVANPAAGRLQRVFGISQLKIDPAFEGGSSTPTARLTLQQRISSNLTFTYTSALDDPNGEIVKVEWAFDPRFSAVATRDQNGIFSVNFLYKRQFH